MIIVDQLKQRSIAEYLLYMWQIEDLIRAYNRNIDNLEKDYINKFQVSAEEHAEMKDWFEGLIKMMELENVRKKGHLQINKNVIIRLADLHQELLKSPKYPEYGAEFYKTLPFIVELRSKAGNEQAGEIETCFNALYGTLILKLQGKKISDGTEDAMKQISRFLALLSKFYATNEQKPLFEDDDSQQG